MKELPSRQFRTAYPRLTESVLVMVHGHPIGTWTPIGEIPTLKMAEVTARAFDVPLKVITSPEERDRLARGQPIGTYAGRPFDARPKPVTQYAIDKAAGRLHIGEPEPRPFTPAPKPGKR